MVAGMAKVSPASMAGMIVFSIATTATTGLKVDATTTLEINFLKEGISNMRG